MGLSIASTFIHVYLQYKCLDGTEVEGMSCSCALNITVKVKLALCLL
jgi:hypothetical protein